jgi:hypothetical protein
MCGNPNEIVKRVEIRRSKLHSNSLHNAIVKLNKLPLEHAGGRSGVEDSILHLRKVHNVVFTDNLKAMLLKANPSEELLKTLFPCCDSQQMSA